MERPKRRIRSACTASIFVSMWDLGTPEGSATPALVHLRSVVARAGQLTTTHPRGPVHLNVPFREPLVDFTEDSAETRRRCVR